MLVLILISVGLLIWGFVAGFESNGGRAVETLLYWAYVMVGLGVASWVLIGGIMMAVNNPKSLIKLGIVAVVIAAVAFVAYLLAAGNPAFGREGLDEVGTLKLTDTSLNLTYFAGGVAILSIIVGEIRLAITNRK